MAVGQVVTNDGRKIALNRTFKATPDYTAPTVFKTGTGTTTPTNSDTDLEKAVPITGHEVVDDCETADWTDSADMTTALNATTFRIGSNSLNLTKDGTASADASTSKTTTSVDFDDKRLEVFLYVDDQTTLDLFATTDCITVRFGSDASNYYQWTKNKADLAVGWNYINNLTDDNEDSTTGTPDNNNMDYTFIQITATASGDTWAAGKVAMDDWRVVEAGDLTKTFVSGYPILDETNHQSTIRGLLLSTEANGHSLSEFGLFNTDSSALMFSHAVFTALTKDNTTQVIFAGS
jgi:hypothetical protein